MELKTKIHAVEGGHDITVTREFDLPVALLFKAYVEAELLEEWMGTKVIKLDAKPHGSYQFITTDPMGNEHHFNGVIHHCETNKAMTRTFEMPGTGFPVQLEFFTFEEDGKDKSKLTMHMIFKSVADRDRLLKLPFAQGINMAHSRLEKIFKNQ